MASLAPLRRLRSCALAIICGKPEEITIIAEQLGADEKIFGTAVDGVDNGHLFHVGKMDFPGDKKLNFYITSSLKQGLVPFAIASGALFAQLRPRFAIHTGVCAGNKNQGIKLLDVVCGDAAMSLEDGKWMFVNNQLTFLPDYETISTPVAGLVQFASSEKGVHYGSYISGSAVRQDAPAIFEKIQTTVTRKVLALEMEASAFLKLCSHSQHTNVLPLGVIKAVSDLGDEDKGKDPDTYDRALCQAGIMVKRWLRSCFSSMTWEANEADEPGAVLARNYYNNYVTRIVDAIAIGANVSVVGDNRATAFELVPCIKVVMPFDDKVENFAEQYQIDRIAEEYNLPFVTVGRKGFSRTAYIMGDCLVDFPRCLNDLIATGDPEPDYQALVFRRQLELKPYFKRGGSDEPQAKVVTWPEFLESCSSR